MFQQKKTFSFLIFAFTAAFLLFATESKEYPRGYKGITLGMTFDEAKQALLKDSDFGYHGERDVSLIPGTNKTLIETDANYGHGSNFLERCWFQFYNDSLFIITVNINQEKMDYYSIFTTLCKKYGNPTNFDPKKATWKSDEVTFTLEKPLTLKYIDNKVFDMTQNYSNISASPTEITQQMFLDEL